MKKTIAIFFGGPSPEHEISILTGVQAFHAIDSSKFDKIAVFVDRNGQFHTGEKLINTNNYKNIDSLLESCTSVSFIKTKSGTKMVSKKLFGTSERPVDCAFLAFHGAYGEGGAFQGYCEIIGLPYTSSNMLGSSLCMDKVSMKKVLETSGIPSSKYQTLLQRDFLTSKENSMKKIEGMLNYPLFVKPSNGGSSIGVNKAKNQQELIQALEVAFSFDSKVLVEEGFKKDSEINISFMGSWDNVIEASISEEVYSDGEFLDFENKYLKGSKSKKTASGSKGMASTNRIIPANVSPQLIEKLTLDGKKAFGLLNCSGLVRIDFLVNRTTEEYVLVEVNTIPGSLAFYLWEKTSLSFEEVTRKMIDLAFEKDKQSKKQVRRFSPQIFKNS